MFYWHDTRTVAIAIEGRRYDTALVIEADGLKTQRIPKGAKLRPLTYKGKPYPKRKAIAHYRRIAKLPGTTKGAKKLLRRIIEG